MKATEFEQCREISRYDDFIEAGLGFDHLSMEDYKDFMPVIFEIVPGMDEKDPVVMYEKVISELRNRWTASGNLPFHGPWHHGLVAGILVCALRNNGYEFSDADIEEALKRGLMMPAGSCGFLGLCGAGAGLGITLSIIQRSTPFHDEERTKAMKASEGVLKRIARLGGPRCCTLSTYTTLRLAGRALKDFGYEIPVSGVGGRCTDHELNPECHGERCPYFPR
jgi:7,8-dihydro-6-hydroxymethylpterin dimethyltransferase